MSMYNIHVLTVVPTAITKKNLCIVKNAFYLYSYEIVISASTM